MTQESLPIKKKQCDIIKVNYETNKATCERIITYINNRNEILEIPLPILERFPSYVEPECILHEIISGKNKMRKANITVQSGDIKELEEYSQLKQLGPKQTHVIKIDYNIFPIGETLLSQNSFNNFKIFNWEFIPSMLLEEYKLTFEVYEEPKITNGIINKLKNYAPKKYYKKIEIYSSKTDIPDEDYKNSRKRIFKIDSLHPTGPSFKIKCSYGSVCVPSKWLSFLVIFIPGFLIGLLSGLGANISYDYFINKFGRI
ncbi:MAG: hypothetical protein K8R58_05790 [Bacteroidales bacterium]|nr:hypothetical protein [Bacteroidales bacterium]